MKVTTIQTGFFKLDGGAMFGIVPKQMWEKLNPPDENNMCTWSMQCLLVEIDDRKILIDTGMGNKQDEKFRSHFEPFGDDNLLQSIQNQGITPDEITDVFLTHLHFDHCGGAISRNTEGVLVPTFSNAIYWTNQVHWDWTMQPNAREAASFLKENFVGLLEKNVLKFVDFNSKTNESVELFPNFFVHFVHGHTEAMMMVRLKMGDKTLLYTADLMPSQWHINLPYVMAYDLRPLETLREKEAVLEQAITEGWYLFFEHDPTAECANLKRNERGRIVIDKIIALSDFLPQL